MRRWRERHFKTAGGLCWIVFCVLSISNCNLFAGSREDIAFKNGELTLSGTLYIPEGEGPFPAVIFVHGSGAETRENSGYSAKWFTSLGFVSLIYDKRGAGKSGGDTASIQRFNLDDLAGDLVAAVEFLSTRQETDKSKIGVHASSQGGWVSSLALTKTDKIAFLIMRSASVTTIGDDRIFERSARLRREGFSDEDIRQAVAMQRVEGKQDGDRKSPDEFTRLFAEYQSKKWFPRVYAGTDAFSPTLTDYRMWYATIVDYDPVKDLSQSDAPIFWIFGDPKMDELGPVLQSIENVEQLKQTGKDYSILQLDGEGHNIREAAYERQLYDWLCRFTDCNKYRFRTH